jgi:hypothetical protein
MARIEFKKDVVLLRPYTWKILQDYLIIPPPRTVSPS